jgi:hypothetical protein
VARRLGVVAQMISLLIIVVFAILITRVLLDIFGRPPRT